MKVMNFPVLYVLSEAENCEILLNVMFSLKIQHHMNTGNQNRRLYHHHMPTSWVYNIITKFALSISILLPTVQCVQVTYYTGWCMEWYVIGSWNKNCNVHIMVHVCIFINIKSSSWKFILCGLHAQYNHHFVMQLLKHEGYVCDHSAVHILCNFMTHLNSQCSVALLSLVS
jgi:hypothetical protein